MFWRNAFISRDKNGNRIIVTERVRKWIILRQEVESYLVIFKFFSLFLLLVTAGFETRTFFVLLKYSTLMQSEILKPVSGAVEICVNLPPVCSHLNTGRSQHPQRAGSKQYPSQPRYVGNILYPWNFNKDPCVRLSSY